ncbi:YheC/YheD family protein [Paenibacillus sp. GSMTC-2017]|uniref:YheC/YheD family protein n=1 Tax=Paenibacillus sp. GSMTC-2017 TaxID=2794350 RepID=UPI0018DA24B8|nr:YheC/YheD family protein [Paenibacillus sp. GSMTC-2017]MBH5319228.1 YheC/YheD family protein [Paenibacillus sp. GSMTC-2017]
MTNHNHDGRQLASKWEKTEALLSHPSLVPHIPPTSRFSAPQLRSMLERHGTVVIKPVVGSGGKGVIKVSKSGNGFSYTHYERTVSYSNFDGLVMALLQKMGQKSYLIQKGISLATVNGRPIDYRVKYVKSFNRWEYRALVGRIARSGLFVTNLSQGGDMVLAGQGIKASLGPSYVKVKKREMRELTVISTRVLEQRFPGIVQLGFDYGIDRQGKIWIFEVNTRPH